MQSESEATIVRLAKNIRKSLIFSTVGSFAFAAFAGLDMYCKFGLNKTQGLGIASYVVGAIGMISMVRILFLSFEILSDFEIARKYSENSKSEQNKI